VGRALIANPEWANQVQAGQSGKLQAYKPDMLATLA
jgi:2,4-dienoyl-CoA reductase-like NADH-dependent reductase (Old Yellow Enzyme family)